MRWLLSLLMLVACKAPPPPTCGEIAGRAKANFTIANAMTSTDLARLEIRVPFDGTFTDEDARAIEAKCAAWDDDYKRCAIAATSSSVRCGEWDVDWWFLPSAKRWLEHLGDLAALAYWEASSRKTAAEAEVSRLEQVIANGQPGLEPELARAKANAAAARALHEQCKASPLEQKACVALLPPAAIAGPL